MNTATKEKNRKENMDFILSIMSDEELDKLEQLLLEEEQKKESKDE